MRGWLVHSACACLNFPCKRPLTRCIAWLLRLFLLSAVRGWVVATARGAVELARTERGEARTEHDCRMLLSYCRLLVEMQRMQEAHALCVEGLRLAGGLEVVLDDGDPSGDFVDARTHEATQRLLAELKAAQERGDDTVRVLEASGRAVCDAHYDTSGGGEKSPGTVKAVVLIKKSGGTQLTVLYPDAVMQTVPADWVLGGGWREDALVFDADGASAGGGGALGAGHPVVLHLKALLPDAGVAMSFPGKDAMYQELIAAWQRCGALERAQIRCLAAFLLALA